MPWVQGPSLDFSVPSRGSDLQHVHSTGSDSNLTDSFLNTKCPPGDLVSMAVEMVTQGLARQKLSGQCAERCSP